MLGFGGLCIAGGLRKSDAISGPGTFVEKPLPPRPDGSRSAALSIRAGMTD